MRICAFFISLFLFIAGFSQEKLNFQRFALNKQLSINVIRHIYQDRDGYIWISTDLGLNKYDGYNITHYFSSDVDSNTLSSDRIIMVLEDSKGYIWVATDKGICRIDKTTNSVKRFYSQNNINCISEAPDGKIWVGSFNGLQILDIRTNKLSIEKSESIPLNSGLTCIKKGINKELWLSFWGHGLTCFDFNTKNLSPIR